MEPERFDRGVTHMEQDFLELYRVAYPRLVRALTVAGGDRHQAEEIVQDAFVRLLGAWTKVRGYDDPEAWVRSVAFRLLSNRRRGAHRFTRWLTSATPAPVVAGPTPDRLDIADALSRIPAEQRIVVVLHHLCGLPVDRIAVELGVPVGTVKSRLSRARAALAPLLHEEITDHA